MSRRITPEQAAAYVERWRRIRDAEREELRRTPLATKLRQLDALMRSVDELGWREDLGRGVETVRERWCRLRAALG